MNRLATLITYYIIYLRLMPNVKGFGYWCSTCKKPIRYLAMRVTLPVALGFVTSLRAMAMDYSNICIQYLFHLHSAYGDIFGVYLSKE